GTQCVMQNTNIDHRAWIDDCAARGIRAVHIWSFVAPRQKQDGSVVESRYGYVYPGITPWARRTSGPDATDQLKQWDLKTFDDGPDGDMTRYWPRLRDLCRHAKSKDMVVGITVFFGWPKHNTTSRPDWSYHPLNVVNGGPVTDTSSPVTQVQLIDTPGTEVWMEEWSDAWPVRKKTQWIWERLCKKFIDDLNGMGNVFFVFMDEHSYSEGNGGDHFLNFFKSRGAVWVDWNARRPAVSWVMSDTLGTTNKNTNAVAGFTGNPARPYLNLEGPPYMGDGLRTSLWSFAIGGGHFFFHDDEAQETEKTGIMGYDPNVVGGDKGMYKRDWLGHASRLFNQHVQELDNLVPHNELTETGHYCLADPGREYLVYSTIGSSLSFSLNLTASSRLFLCRFYDPRTGQFGSSFQRQGGSMQSFIKPDLNDWVLHLTVEPGIAGDFDHDGDVDLADFGHLQMCFTGSGEVVADTACLDAILDGDSDIDAADLQVFVRCLSGADVPANAECAL
ncbi:MAG: putative collagen-binding domain-containing protein, partial [Phycisphaerae bacterium]